ncbi:MAG TPA: invasion associated locus B family protein [Xanthobacteraceae bacterium]
MNVGIVSAPTWSGARAFAVALTMLAVTASSSAFAQAPAPAQPAPKAQPKAQPKAAPQAAPAAAPAQAAAPDVPPLTYTPWTKVCVKGQEANAQQVCFTGKEGRLDTGMLVIGAVVIEPEGSAAKTLRITLPLGMQLQPGTRVIVDQGQPMNAPYMICSPIGCMADYEASGELIGKFKKGQSMVVQAINSQGGAINLPVPLPDFAKAYDGPPTDPKVLEERQKKLQEEFQKKQQQLQQQQQAPK